MGQFANYKMNCSLVFDNDTKSSTGQTKPASDSKISTALVNLLRRRGVTLAQIAAIQAKGLSDAQLQMLGARRKLTDFEISFMRARRVPVQQINAWQVRGLSPSDIIALRRRALLPATPHARPRMSAPGTRARFPPVLPPGGTPSIRFPSVTPAGSVPTRPVGGRPRGPVVPPTVRRPRLTLQQLQVLSSRLTPVNLVVTVRRLSIADIMNLAKDMTPAQFVAMWKILTPQQQQMILPNLSAPTRALIQASSQSRGVSPLQTLSPEELRRLGTVLSVMNGGDKSTLPTSVFGPNGLDAGTIRVSPSIISGAGTQPGSPSIGTVTLPEIGGESGTGTAPTGGAGVQPSSGTGTLTPDNADGGEAIRFAVTPTNRVDPQLNEGNSVKGNIRLM